MSKQGRFHHLCWATLRAAGQHRSVPDWAPDMDWILITGTSVRLGLSELPQWKDRLFNNNLQASVIFGHIHICRGVFNFPTWGIAETGTWKVFYLFGFDQVLNNEHLKKSEPGVSINESFSFLTVYPISLLFTCWSCFSCLIIPGEHFYPWYLRKRMMMLCWAITVPANQLQDFLEDSRGWRHWEAGD